MKSKLISIPQINSVNKYQDELYKIHSSNENGINIRKEINFEKNKVISVDLEDERDLEILKSFAGQSDVIVEDNQILSIPKPVKSSGFLETIKSFFLVEKDYYPNKPINLNHRIKYKINVVAVLDTGLSDNIINIQGSVYQGINTCGAGNPTIDITDKQGHGTFVSSIVCWNNAGLCLYPIKVLGDEGKGSLDDIAEGLQYALVKADVINMSLGGGGYSQIFHNIIKEVTSKGIIICCASGNEGGSVSYPAAYPECIPVGSYNQYNKISSFSNFGPEMVKGLVAPGENISGLGLDGVSMVKMSGTSMATPYVSGCCSMMKYIDNSINTETARELFKQSCNKIKGVSEEMQGYGRLDPHTLIDILFKNF